MTQAEFWKEHVGNDTRSQDNLACSSQPHVLSISDRTNEGFEPLSFKRGEARQGKGAERSLFHLPSTSPGRSIPPSPGVLPFPAGTPALPSQGSEVGTAGWGR